MTTPRLLQRFKLLEFIVGGHDISQGLRGLELDWLTALAGHAQGAKAREGHGCSVAQMVLNKFAQLRDHPPSLRWVRPCVLGQLRNDLSIPDSFWDT